MSAEEIRALMSAPGNDRLTWNTPLSEEHAAQLIAALRTRCRLPGSPTSAAAGASC